MLFSQTYTNWKLLIIDNNSTAQHKKIISEIKSIYAEDNRIIFMETETEMKNAKILNMGLHYFLKHDFTNFTWISHENEYHPNCLHELVYINKFFTYSQYIYRKNIKIQKLVSPNYTNIERCITHWIGCGACMWSRDAIQQLGYFMEDIVSAENYEYVLRSLTTNFTECNFVFTPLMTVVDQINKIVPNYKPIYNLYKHYIQKQPKILEAHTLDANTLDTNTNNKCYELSIIILCHNNLNYTKQCIESVVKNTSNIDFIINVVNNNSTDNTNAYLKKLSVTNKLINVINNNNNICFANGMNIGIKHSNSKYIILLHNDTIVHENWDLDLIRILKENNTVCAVTPITNCSNNECCIKLTHTDPTDFFYKIEKIQPTLLKEFPSKSLALFCCAFRKCDFDELGYLDELYKNGLEEADLYERICKLNKTVVITTSSIVYHFGNVTISKTEQHNTKKLNMIYF
jgi:GT2 family glycosyltransferase